MINDNAQNDKDIKLITEITRSLKVALWFVFLTFPLLVIKVDALEKTVEYRWQNMLYVAIGTFLVSLLSKFFLDQNTKRKERAALVTEPQIGFLERIFNEPKYLYPIAFAACVFALIFPLIFSPYQTNIMTTALMYVVLGLGLNIVVGMAGLLDLGFVAFYAVGAYSYALLNTHFDLGFWIVLPIGAILAALFGIILGFPVLRLRGDYLAIVTLGFGEIIRLVLENWNEFSQGPSGISNIDRPGLFGMELTLNQSINYMFYIMIALVLFTIFFVNRLQNSRLGRAWIALREDEIACQAMGIDKTKTKLTAFALGATWAGMVGVIFAAKTTFINPASFTFLESAIILAIVVIGGMGSIVGVIVGAFVLILLPEYLRALSDYRMLAFGAIMVMVMIYRPQGIISNVRKHIQYDPESKTAKKRVDTTQAGKS
ncbi:high-affinity branched-chain amino acid ABC transporter permease LivM [Cocleimonas sp. KMM 6892]|uniref:ABC transporter permease subunit n=1 Tax=unclassified Cocleimonas TaxID=2639732 RepID=UPI002DBA89D0|nr:MULTISPECIES: high-affinity branched-chain amino acid ABC transporter permease LivM [unclassified Cocleimonas]MEB8431959.1 high-affinity branched-chain amino acid ABC transporter permease LivM [Cocleimonas sp. KMM 6892]MEC4714955.1 high-affinity branched-chain amino acid ABC transporter permease LivM [Cocleimonas sp. KMM 6895]MEC4744231.1 high-affinity branched-chain amino acid ABC transporter permease LivM [Cocleimonas sp. KMM 6896]